MSRMSEAKDRLNEKLGNTRKARAEKAMKMALRKVMGTPALRERMLAEIDRREFYAGREKDLELELAMQRKISNGR